MREREKENGERSSRVQTIRNVFVFFQAEDGIRDYKVTGVQTCALPISSLARLACSVDSTFCRSNSVSMIFVSPETRSMSTSCGAKTKPSRSGCAEKIGRASCRERV